MSRKETAMRDDNSHDPKEMENVYRQLLSHISEEERDKVLKDINQNRRISHTDLYKIPGSVLIGRRCPPHIADRFLDRRDTFRVFLHGNEEIGPEEFKWARKKRAIFDVSELLGKNFTAFLTEGCMRDDSILLDPEDRFIASSDVLPQETSVIFIVAHHHRPPHATATLSPNGRKIVLLEM